MTRTFRLGLVMGAFEYRQAEEIRNACARHGVRYLFLGKSGAILPKAQEAFQPDGKLKDAKTHAAVENLGARLTEVLRKLHS